MKNEVGGKLNEVRERLRSLKMKAARFRGVEWFAWVTGGGNATVILTSEVGIAEVLITAEDAFVLTNQIEEARLKQEELPPEFQIHSSPWAEGEEALDRFASRIARPEETMSDRPRGEELALAPEIKNLKLVLSSAEIERYRALGRDAAEAMQMALMNAEPTWTESQLAGEGAKQMWSRGLHATLLLVAGEKRLPLYRHPFPSNQHLGGRAMMVFCARRNGLYANLTRFVYFRPPSAEEVRLHQDVAIIEAKALDLSCNGETTSAVYRALRDKYGELGYGDEIFKHHQGGPTGYLSRETIANPSRAMELKNGMAVAWNPSLPGVKIEDTFLIAENGVENLTDIESWPSEWVQGRRRPSVLIKAGESKW